MWLWWWFRRVCKTRAADQSHASTAWPSGTSRAECQRRWWPRPGESSAGLISPSSCPFLASRRELLTAGCATCSLPDFHLSNVKWIHYSTAFLWLQSFYPSAETIFLCLFYMFVPKLCFIPGISCFIGRVELSIKVWIVTK